MSRLNFLSAVFGADPVFSRRVTEILHDPKSSISPFSQASDSEKYDTAHALWYAAEKAIAEGDSRMAAFALRGARTLTREIILSPEADDISKDVALYFYSELTHKIKSITGSEEPKFSRPMAGLGRLGFFGTNPLFVTEVSKKLRSGSPTKAVVADVLFRTGERAVRENDPWMAANALRSAYTLAREVLLSNEAPTGDESDRYLALHVVSRIHKLVRATGLPNPDERA